MPLKIWLQLNIIMRGSLNNLVKIQPGTVEKIYRLINLYYIECGQF